ncbi:MAG: hypothetical protein WCP32_12615, partial [Bacteroidota bacterium]
QIFGTILISAISLFLFEDGLGYLDLGIWLYLTNLPTYQLTSLPAYHRTCLFIVIFPLPVD